MKHCFLFFICSLCALEITIQNIPLTVELATTQKAREQGLSGRKTLEDEAGMLFIYEEAQICHFWMKDTLIALSIGFFDRNFKLIEWKDMPIPGELTIVSSSKLSKYALEVPKGWFAKHQILPGAHLQLTSVPK